GEFFRDNDRWKF
ncbi:UDP-glucose 4-epimerase, partial [Candidatus Hakubella thermalkaliphila]